MYSLGLDLGSSYTKGVLVSDDGGIVDRMAIRTGYDFKAAAETVIQGLSKKHNPESPIYSCGYGRDQVEVPFVAVSEVVALAKAVFHIRRSEAVVLDIGGQDTKYIKITNDGLVDNFRLNRKCAAGTGSFLEEIASRLQVPSTEFSKLAEQATREIKLNSYCTVFAISEIIGLIKKGETLPNIVCGVYNSVIARAKELAPKGELLVLTGGVPVIHSMIVKLFKDEFANVENPADGQFLAAYGAVLINR